MFTNRLQAFEKIIAFSLIFLIPTQLAFHFWPQSSFVFGIRVDYLSPAVYLTDLLITLLIFLWLINDKKSLTTFLNNHKLVITVLLLFITSNILLSTSIWISLFKWLKIIEISLFGLYIYIRKSFLEEEKILLSIFLSSVFFSAIGIAQFFLRATTGIFYILGERAFSTQTPGIALLQINGRDFLRVYSTLPHPNALAGYLGAVLLLIVGSNFLKEKKYLWGGLIATTVCFILTFSLTGVISFFTALVIYIFKKNKMLVQRGAKVLVWLTVLLSLFLPFVSSNQLLRSRLSKNLAERLDLSYLSGKMISDRFLFGEGLNTFIKNIPSFNKALTSPWLLQPVHNIYLLVLAETGILGLLIFLWGVFLLLAKLSKKDNFIYLPVFVFILLTGTMDHYWFTIQQNLLLLSFLLGFF
ncbi:MAG TPA: O-antigen ligase family protein [Patescibacteria group bacterium]|nr:O-antigen ligase family protein [Patescibacteria group bacterium]